MKRTNNPHQISELFAVNIFGNVKPNTSVVRTPFMPNVSTQDALREQISRLQHAKRTRKSRILFTEVTQDVTPLRAVLPYLTSKAMELTMNNYREFVSQHNQRVLLYNDEIAKYNVSVKNFRDKEELNKVQLKFSALFLLKNCNLDATKYNILAEEFNAEYGLLIEKKKETSIKYTSESVFQQMLHLYAKQLKLHSDQHLKLGITDETTIKPFEVNSYHVVNLKRKGVFSIDVCTRTIRNHRERLEQAGILYNYIFKGSKKGADMHVNSQILVVFDAKTQNFVGAENQSVNPDFVKNFPDNNDVTRTLESNINKRDYGKADNLDKGLPAAAFSFSFYKSIPPQEEKSKPDGGGENVKVSQTMSDKLQNSIIHNQELAKNLSAGQYVNYKRLDKRYLFEEAYSGQMSRSDFKTLIIQEFFKNAARLYRNSPNVWVGCWKKAINSYQEKLFLVNNGNGTFLYSKEMMVEQLDRMLWQLNDANQWFMRTKINPLYPSEYFDFTRTTSKEIGFEYTRKRYDLHIKNLEKKPALTKQLLKKAKIRKEKIDHSKKFDFKLNQFFNNKVSYTALIEYVNTNLPAEYLTKLSERLIKIQTQYTC